MSYVAANASLRAGILCLVPLLSQLRTRPLTKERRAPRGVVSDAAQRLPLVLIQRAPASSGAPDVHSSTGLQQAQGHAVLCNSVVSAADDNNQRTSSSLRVLGLSPAPTPDEPTRRRLICVMGGAMHATPGLVPDGVATRPNLRAGARTMARRRYMYEHPRQAGCSSAWIDPGWSLFWPPPPFS